MSVQPNESKSLDEPDSMRRQQDRSKLAHPALSNWLRAKRLRQARRRSRSSQRHDGVGDDD